MRDFSQLGKIIIPIDCDKLCICNIILERLLKKLHTDTLKKPVGKSKCKLTTEKNTKKQKNKHKTKDKWQTQALIHPQLLNINGLHMAIKNRLAEWIINMLSTRTSNIMI